MCVRSKKLAVTEMVLLLLISTPLLKHVLVTYSEK